MCGKPITKGRLVWALDKAKAVNGVQLERRGSPDVLSSYARLADRFNEGAVAARRQKVSVR